MWFFVMCVSHAGIPFSMRSNLKYRIIKRTRDSPCRVASVWGRSVMLATTRRKQFAALPSISTRTRDTWRQESKVENWDQLTMNRWLVNKKRLASSKRNRNLSILNSKRKKKKEITRDLIKKKILAHYFVIIAIIFQNYQLSLNLHYQIIFSNKMYYIIQWFFCVFIIIGLSMFTIICIWLIYWIKLFYFIFILYLKNTIKNK